MKDHGPAKTMSPGVRAMLVVGSALNGFNIKATDGTIGVSSDFLLDDATWKLRWLVVDTGTWLNSRKLLLHPSAIGMVDYEHEEIPVKLTQAQVAESPPIARDEPVSRQMEASLYGYYGCDPLWGGSYLGGAGMVAPLIMPALAPSDADPEHGDPHLRSLTDLKTYHAHGTDGLIGHIENLIIDDETWDVRYFIVDTRNWWPGRHVLLSPVAVREIDWQEHEIWLNVSRSAVEGSPPWKPFDMIDEVYQKRIHRHYGWAGY